MLAYLKMVSKATNMVLGSGKKKRPCNQVKDSHGKTILAKTYYLTWAFFYEDKFNFSVISVDSFIALFCFVIWRILQLHLQKKSFFEWMCFLHLPIITNSKGKGNEKQEWIHEQVLTPRAVTDGSAEALQRRDFLEQYPLNEYVACALELKTFNICIWPTQFH